MNQQLAGQHSFNGQLGNAVRANAQKAHEVQMLELELQRMKHLAQHQSQMQMKDLSSAYDSEARRTRVEDRVQVAPLREASVAVPNITKWILDHRAEAGMEEARKKSFSVLSQQPDS